MKNIGYFYLNDWDFERRKELPIKRYMIAGIPRTGSSLLSLLLWRTGCLGAPLEYLNFANIAPINRKLSELGLPKYWEELLYTRTSSNGVFGIKIFLYDYLEVGRKNRDMLPVLNFDNVIFLTRRDKIAQAVSYARAIMTKQWFAGVDGLEAKYDYEAINNASNSIGQQEAAWEKIFLLTDTSPIRILYEDISANIDSAATLIASELGVDLDKRARVHLQLIDRQSDKLSSEWIERYKCDALLASSAGEP